MIATGSRDCSLVDAVNRAYPGRASMSPLMDVFITLLSLGKAGGKKSRIIAVLLYWSMLSRHTMVETAWHRGISSRGNPQRLRTNKSVGPDKSLGAEDFLKAPQHL